MSVSTDPRISAGTQVISFLAELDFESLSSCFSEDCRMRAFTPNNIYASIGRNGATESFRTWFGLAQALAVVDQSVEVLSDRIRIRYLLDLTEHDERALCEQVGYFDVEDGNITDLTLICSGKRPYVELVQF